mmetsp:Transcript_86033/g.152398  ORF Transcript_86033/g.152398 Transcript_86033/m.152398 type:complete len:218 (-) Transcript_86033:98-751(-)
MAPMRSTLRFSKATLQFWNSSCRQALKRTKEIHPTVCHQHAWLWILGDMAFCRLFLQVRQMWMERIVLSAKQLVVCVLSSYWYHSKQASTSMVARGCCLFQSQRTMATVRYVLSSSNIWLTLAHPLLNSLRSGMPQRATVLPKFAAFSNPRHLFPAGGDFFFLQKQPWQTDRRYSRNCSMETATRMHATVEAPPPYAQHPSLEALRAWQCCSGQVPL